MSLPFFRTKAQAQRFWGRKEPLKRVYVPASRGFLQAPTSGYYWVSKVQAAKLRLGASKPKARGR